MELVEEMRLYTSSEESVRESRYLLGILLSDGRNTEELLNLENLLSIQEAMPEISIFFGIYLCS